MWTVSGAPTSGFQCALDAASLVEFFGTCLGSGERRMDDGTRCGRGHRCGEGWRLKRPIARQTIFFFANRLQIDFQRENLGNDVGLAGFPPLLCPVSPQLLRFLTFSKHLIGPVPGAVPASHTIRTFCMVSRPDSPFSESVLSAREPVEIRDSCGFYYNCNVIQLSTATTYFPWNWKKNQTVWGDKWMNPTSKQCCKLIATNPFFQSLSGVRLRG